MSPAVQQAGPAPRPPPPTPMGSDRASATGSSSIGPYSLAAWLVFLAGSPPALHHFLQDSQVPPPPGSPPGPPGVVVCGPLGCPLFCPQGAPCQSHQVSAVGPFSSFPLGSQGAVGSEAVAAVLAEGGGSPLPLTCHHPVLTLLSHSSLGASLPVPVPQGLASLLRGFGWQLTRGHVCRDPALWGLLGSPCNTQGH